MKKNSITISCVLCSIILLVFLLDSCGENADNIKINKDEYGYHLMDHLGEGQNNVLSGLYQANADPQFYYEMEYLGSTVRYYVLLEEQKNLEFEVSLIFINYPDIKEFTLSGYEAKLELDHWPTEAEQESLQSIYDLIRSKFGDPTHKEFISSDNLLFDNYKTTKYGSWDEKDISFIIDYDPVTNVTIIRIWDYDSPFYRYEKSVV